jgi:hypothetical protein
MGFLDRKSRVVDIVLTGRGRELFALGKLEFTHYAFFDDGIDYDPWYSGTLSNDEREESIYSSPTLEAPFVPDRRSTQIPLEPTSFLFKAAPDYGTIPRMVNPNPTGSTGVLRCDQFSSGSSFIRTGTSLVAIPLELSAETAGAEGFSIHFHVSGSDGLTEVKARTDLDGRRVLDPFVAVAVDEEQIFDVPIPGRPDSTRRGGRQ